VAFSRSRFWLSVLANVLNIPIMIADGETGRRLVRRDWGAWLSLAKRSKPSAHPLNASRHSNLSAHSQTLTRAASKWRKLYRPRR